MADGEGTCANEIAVAALSASASKPPRRHHREQGPATKATFKTCCPGAVHEASPHI